MLKSTFVVRHLTERKVKFVTNYFLAKRTSCALIATSMACIRAGCCSHEDDIGQVVTARAYPIIAQSWLSVYSTPCKSHVATLSVAW